MDFDADLSEQGPAGIVAGGAAGGDLSGTYPNPSIATAAVTTAKLAAGAVTAAKIDAAYDALLAHLAGMESFSGDKTFAGKLVVAGGLVRSPRTKQTSAFTIAAADSVVPIDTTGGAFTATLPTIASVPDGWTVRVEDVGGLCGTNNLAIVAQGGDTILDGASVVALVNNWGWIELRRAGSSWKVVGWATVIGVGRPGLAANYQGGTVVAYKVVNANYQPTAGDSRIIASVAGLTFTLDSALPDGTQLDFIDASGGASASPHSFAPNNSRTLNGSATTQALLNRNYGGNTALKYAGNWIVPQ